MYSNPTDIYEDPIEEYCKRVLHVFSLWGFIPFQKQTPGGQDDVSRGKARSLRSFPSGKLKVPGTTVNTGRKTTAKNINQSQED